MHNESLPVMPFPSPSSTLLERADAEAPSGQLRSWMRALPETIQRHLNRWQAEWTGESLRQGYLGYVLPCRRQDGTAAILKLSPDAHGAEEQATALSAWAGDGAVSLLAKSFEENGAALLISRVVPGVALRPLDDPAGERIACCLQRLAHIPALSVRGSLPSGLERLNALIAANACHLHALSPLLQRPLPMPSRATVVRKSAPSCSTVTFTPVTSWSAATMNSWRSTRRQHLASPSKTSEMPPRKTTGAKICPRELNSWPKPARLTPQKRRLTPVSRLGTAASSTPPQEPRRQEEWTRTICSSTRPPTPGSCSSRPGTSAHSVTRGTGGLSSGLCPFPLAATTARGPSDCVPPWTGK